MTRGPVVLVVDDKRNMVRLMSKVLRGDATVRTAESGGDALRLLASEHIDVVLCDLQMPDMDGLDVLRACKRLAPRSEFINSVPPITPAAAAAAVPRNEPPNPLPRAGSAGCG